MKTVSLVVSTDRFEIKIVGLVVLHYEATQSRTPTNTHRHQNQTHTSNLQAKKSFWNVSRKRQLKWVNIDINWRVHISVLNICWKEVSSYIIKSLPESTELFGLHITCFFLDHCTFSNIKTIDVYEYREFENGYNIRETKTRDGKRVRDVIHFILCLSLG